MRRPASLCVGGKSRLASTLAPPGPWEAPFRFSHALGPLNHPLAHPSGTLAPSEGERDGVRGFIGKLTSQHPGDDLAEFEQRLVNRLRPWRAAVQPNEVPELLFGGENRTGRDADLFLQRPVEQFYGIDLRREFDPEHIPAGGTRHPGAFGEIFRDRVSDTFELFGVNAPQSAQMMVEPAVRQKIRNRQLRQRRRKPLLSRTR